MAEKVVPPGVEERVKRIMEVCDPDLEVFLDNLDMVLRKKEPMTDWERQAIKKSLITLLDCVDSTEEEFR